LKYGNIILHPTSKNPTTMDQLPTDAFLQQQRFTRSTHRDVYPFITPSNPVLSQHNRIIVITGASRGLGHLAFARSFAAAGAKALVLGARNTSKLELVRQDLLKDFPTVEVVVEQLYVEQSASQVQFWSIVKRNFGRADVLCSNAGIDPGNATVKDIDPALWCETMVSYGDAAMGRSEVLTVFSRILTSRDTFCHATTFSSSSQHPQRTPLQIQPSSTLLQALLSYHLYLASQPMPSQS
jgi:hypothetical protein